MNRAPGTAFGPLPDRLNMATEVCDRWAEATPDAPAILEPLAGGVQATSFGLLRQMADRLAHVLRALGVGPGDRVAIYRGQSPWTAAAHIAVWKLGAISLPLFTLFGPDALRARMADSGACLALAEPDSYGALAALWPELPALREILVPEALPPGGPGLSPFETAATGPEDPAVLIYTSGTTGRSKGALHAHRVLRGHLPGVELSHDLLGQTGDRLWTPADWAWIGGLFDVLMPGLWHGLPVVAARMPRFDAAEALRIIQAAGVRNVFFPPTALRMLKAAGLRLSGLRSVASGGEPLGAEMRAWGLGALGVTINEFYGQTECNMIVSACAALYETPPGAMGRPVPGHQVAVIDAAGQPTTGEGDIAVRRGSPAMMLGFWNDPEATAARFRGDWLLTGDRGVQEAEALRFLGRGDDVITQAGYRIGPAEIEDCLLTHPAVVSAGVVGAPDPLRGQVVTAFVVLAPGQQGDAGMISALQDHVRTRLSAHLYPRRVYFTDHLPLTVTGKIIRAELRARAAEPGA